MLESKDAMATIAVRDLNVARKFYEGTLGLMPVNPGDSGGIVYRSGNSSILVYTSQFAGTNKATAATWVVGDVDGVVRELKGKGVGFEHYDLPSTARQGDVHVAGKMRIAWFKDPDGNIISLASQ